VGDVINFRGSATDAQDGNLPASGLTWQLTLWHCPSNCHTHGVQEFAGASGSFTAPDHEYPSYLELTLTATDSGGLTDTKTLRLDPKTVALTFQTTPAGLKVTVNGTQTKATFTRTVIVGSTNTISAVSPQTTETKSHKTHIFSPGPTAVPRPTASPLRPRRPPTQPGARKPAENRLPVLRYGCGAPCREP
jgi:hypothetical protein